MRAPCTVLLVLPTLGTGSYGSEIRKGAIMDVQQNSIWFDEIAECQAPPDQIPLAPRINSA
jgi:hypothetical protein